MRIEVHGKLKFLKKLYTKKRMSKSTELKPVDQYCYTVSVSECNKRYVILIYHRY